MGVQKDVYMQYKTVDDHEMGTDWRKNVHVGERFPKNLQNILYRHVTTHHMTGWRLAKIDIAKQLDDLLKHMPGDRFLVPWWTKCTRTLRDWDSQNVTNECLECKPSS